MVIESPLEHDAHLMPMQMISGKAGLLHSGHILTSGSSKTVVVCPRHC